MNEKTPIKIEFLDIHEIAEVLEVSDWTVYRYLRGGVIKGRKIGGKWKATREEVIKYMTGE